MNEDNILTSLTGRSLKDIAAVIYKLSQDVERYKEREANRGFVGTFMGCPVHADLSTVDKGARANRLAEICRSFRDSACAELNPITVRTEDKELRVLIAEVECKNTQQPERRLLLHIARKLS